IMDKKDYSTAIARYHAVLVSAANYRVQCSNLGHAAYEFGHALENLARSPGAGDAASGLSSTSGLHYIVANQYALLSNTIFSQFEDPLRESLETFSTSAIEKEKEHDQKVAALSETIQHTENEYVLGAQRGGRELGQFRQALQELTGQLDRLEQLKHDYVADSLQSEQTMANAVLQQASVTIRALTDICDRVSHKAVTDPQLEALLSHCPDPFQVYETTDSSREIFSVLQPLAMMGTSSGGSLRGSLP
ncbi:hypothetical protein BJ085DRAFT_12725, partial [Dimargaris cristalligena]